MVQENLQSYQREVDSMNKAGRKIPPNLLEDIQETQTRLNALQQDLEKIQY